VEAPGTKKERKDWQKVRTRDSVGYLITGKRCVVNRGSVGLIPHHSASGGHITTLDGDEREELEAKKRRFTDGGGGVIYGKQPEARSLFGQDSSNTEDKSRRNKKKELATGQPLRFLSA